MLTDDQLKHIRLFNENIEWLKKNHRSVPYENNTNEWIKITEALAILERSRTWLQSRLLKPDEIKQPMNVHWFLVRGLDWEREGNQLIFKRTSVLRLKQELRSLGNVYDEKLAQNNVLKVFS